jgi:hypothetical protein
MNVRTLLCAGALCVTLPGAVAAQQSVIASYMNGTAYLRLNPAIRTLYIEGLLEGMSGGLGFNPDQSANKALMTCTQHMDGNQVRAIVDKYLAENPAQWDWPMGTLTGDAMAYACAQRGSKLFN